MKQNLLLCILLLQGCTSPPTQFYTLSSVAHAVDSQVIGKKKLVGVAQLSLPSALERKQLVTRDRAGDLHLDEQHQWAALLKQNMTEVIAKNLANQHPNLWFKAYPWSNIGAVDYRLVLDVTRFEIILGQSVYFSVDWTFLDEKQHTVVNHASIDLMQPLIDDEYKTAVTAINQLLAQLTTQLASILTAF